MVTAGIIYYVYVHITGIIYYVHVIYYPWLRQWHGQPSADTRAIHNWDSSSQVVFSRPTNLAQLDQWYRPKDVATTGFETQNCVARGKQTDSCVAKGKQTDSCVARGKQTDSYVASGKQTDSCVARGKQTDSCVARGKQTDISEQPPAALRKAWIISILGMSLDWSTLLCQFGPQLANLLCNAVVCLE